MSDRRSLLGGGAGVGGVELAYAENRTARAVTDGVLNTTTTVTSATAAFVAGDVGRILSGTGIPANTTIASVTNGTTVVLSAAATATSSGVTLTLGNYPITTTGVFKDMAGCVIAPAATSRPLWLKARVTTSHSVAGGLFTAQLIEVSNGVDTVVTRGTIRTHSSAGAVLDNHFETRIAASTARQRTFKLQIENNTIGTLTVFMPGAADIYDLYVVAEAK